MSGRAVAIATLLAALRAGGLVLAQEDQAVERSAPPPPSEAPAPPPLEPAPALGNAVTPDEAAPPPDAAVDEGKPVESPVAAPNRTAQANVASDEPPPPPPPPPPPLKRPRFPAAILQAVDKSTGETLRFEAKVGQPIRYKGLTLAVHACETPAADEDFSDSIAHLEVSSQPQVVAGRHAAPARQVFRGWMFAESPSLHPLEHPLYDVWLIACKTDAPPAPGASL